MWLLHGAICVNVFLVFALISFSCFHFFLWLTTLIYFCRGSYCTNHTRKFFFNFRNYFLKGKREVPSSKAPLEAFGGISTLSTAGENVAPSYCVLVWNIVGWFDMCLSRWNWILCVGNMIGNALELPLKVDARRLKLGGGMGQGYS
jgi:hypothetical protein